MRRNTRLLFIAMASLWSILILALLPTCSLLQKVAKAANPEIHVKGISIKDVNLDGISFHIDAELINQLPVPLPATALNLDVLVNEHKLSSLKTAPVSVAASSSTPLPFDVGIRYADLSGVIRSMGDVPSWKLGLKGAMNFRVDLPGFPEAISVPFAVEKTVPSFLPEISVSSVQLRHPDVSTMLGSLFTKEIKLGLDLDLTVRNRGGAKFSLSEMNYAVSLEGKKLFDGKTTSSTAAPDGRSSSLRISTDIAVKDSLQSLVSALQKKSIPYELKGNMAIDFPGVDFNRIQLPVSKDGKIGL